MYLLEIIFENGLKGEFKTKRKTKDTSCISMLSPNILKGERIAELEKHGRLKCSFEYYNCQVRETKIDGRKAIYKDIKWFSFGYCFANLEK